MRNRRKRALLAAVFATGLMAFAGPAAAQSLADAIALAYSTNPSLLQQRASLRIQDESFYQQQRDFGPDIGASVVVTGGTDNDIDDDFAGRSSAGLTATLDIAQPVYSGGRLSAQEEAAKTTLQSQRETLRRAEMALIVNVVQVYTEVRRLEAQLDISRQNVEVLQRQREEAQARFEVGQQTRTDVAQADARLASARSGFISAQNNLNNARERFRTVVGRMPEQLQPEPTIAPNIPASSAAAFQVAEQQNPTLRQAYLDERTAAANVAVAKSARRPTVNFTTGLSGSQSNSSDFRSGSGFGDFSAGLTTGLRLSVPLYTGLTTSSSIRQAIERNRSAEIGIEGARRTLNENVTAQWNGLVAARASITSNEEAVRSAELAYQGTREEQQVGLRATLDVLNAEQELRQAQQSLINARFTEYTSMVGLLNQMGVLTPEMFGAQVDTYDPKKHFEEVNSFALPWEGLVKTIDKVGAPAIPERQPLPGENVPTQEPLR